MKKKKLTKQRTKSHFHMMIFLISGWILLRKNCNFPFETSSFFLIQKKNKIKSETQFKYELTATKWNKRHNI